jgi:hypothetical protein
MTERIRCDFKCGRNAVMKVGKLNLCTECADSNPEGDDSMPKLRLEDLVTLDGPIGDEIL